MDFITVAVGFIAIGYGLYTLRLRTKNPAGFGKLESMRKLFGGPLGSILHIAAYTALPIGLGGWLVWAGWHGTSLLEAIP